MDHSVLTDKNCYRHFKIVKALSFVNGLLRPKKTPPGVGPKKTQQ